MKEIEIILPPASAKGSLGIMHLKRYWEKCQLQKKGLLAPDALQDEWNTDITMLAALGLGLEQTIKYVYHSSSGFDEFESWILQVNHNKLSAEKIEGFNSSFRGYNIATSSADRRVFDDDAIECWKENGYVIIPNAVPKDNCDATVELICEYIGIKKDDPSTWYSEHPARQGIMVQLFQHPLLQKNRESEKIRLAYEQLWERKDLWLNTDRVGFNPPETDRWKFPGPGLHWDISLQLPIPFGLQGILYLTDTATNQGAFTLVPGFHKKVEQWLYGLPPGAHPRNENIHALGAMPIAANAGDFIIWHHALPHGSSPNTSTLPRFVQYINYAPADMEIREKWI